MIIFDGKLRVSTSYEGAANGFPLWLYIDYGDGRIATPDPIVMTTHDPQVDGYAPWRQDPLLILPKAAAQEMLDDLWRAGMRPSEQQFTAETIAAQKAHIADLRQICSVLLVQSNPSKTDYSEADFFKPKPPIRPMPNNTTGP